MSSEIKPCVLIADDDPIMRSIVVAKLRSSPYELVEVADGMEAWRVVRSRPIQLALLDIQMPGMDGLTLVQCMRGFASTRHTPIVMVTSRDDHATLQLALEAGATSYLTKPINWALFSHHVEHLIRAGQQAAASDATMRELDAIAGARGALLCTLQKEALTPVPVGALPMQSALQSEFGTTDNTQAAAPAVPLETIRLAAWTDVLANVNLAARGEMSLWSALNEVSDAAVGDRAQANFVFQNSVSDVILHGYSHAMMLLGQVCLDLVQPVSMPAQVSISTDETSASVHFALPQPKTTPTIATTGADLPPLQTVETHLAIIEQIAMLHGGESKLQMMEAGGIGIQLTFASDVVKDINRDNMSPAMSA